MIEDNLTPTASDLLIQDVIALGKNTRSPINQIKIHEKLLFTGKQLPGMHEYLSNIL